METKNIKRLLILAVTLCALMVPVQAAVYRVPLQKILKLKQNFSFTSKNIKKQNIS
jgi:hypothetical protein